MTIPHPIPRYPDGNIYTAYRVSLRKGIEPVPFTCVRYGNIHFSDGTTGNARTFRYTEETAQRHLAALRRYYAKACRVAEQRQKEKRNPTLTPELINILSLYYGEGLSDTVLSDRLQTNSRHASRLRIRFCRAIGIPPVRANSAEILERLEELKEKQGFLVAT